MLPMMARDQTDFNTKLDFPLLGVHSVGRRTVSSWKIKCPHQIDKELLEGVERYVVVFLVCGPSP